MTRDSIASKETVLTRRARRWEGLLPYWLILPTVAYLGLFFVWPMIQGFGLALRDETGNWTLSAFDTMVNDAAFDDAIRFTFLLILVIVPIQFVLAFGMALLLNARLRAGGSSSTSSCSARDLGSRGRDRLVGDLHGAWLSDTILEGGRGHRSALHLPRPDLADAARPLRRSGRRSGARRRS